MAIFVFKQKTAYEMRSSDWSSDVCSSDLNAILIVEFAAAEMRAGKPLLEAAVTAARLRLRPILMTSLAFVFGVLPLAVASGAGSGGQNAIGRSVVGGMISATVLAIFFVPL